MSLHGAGGQNAWETTNMPHHLWCCNGLKGGNYSFRSPPFAKKKVFARTDLKNGCTQRFLHARTGFPSTQAGFLQSDADFCGGYVFHFVMSDGNKALPGNLLKATSRSFYLTLRVLPARVRPQNGLT